MKDTAAKKEGGQGAFWLELGLTLGALVGIVAGRRLAEPLPMNRAGLWQRLLAERLGDMDAAMLMARVQAQYDELFARRPRFAHRALRMH